jgi:hypothetical protein
MRMYSIEGKGDSPYVLLDEAGSLLEISGNFTLKDTYWFYGNLFRWMIAFNRGPYKTRTVNIRLKRINDSSLNQITLMFRKLANSISASDVEINWFVNGRSEHLPAIGRALQVGTSYGVNLLSHNEAC